MFIKTTVFTDMISKVKPILISPALLNDIPCTYKHTHPWQSTGYKSVTQLYMVFYGYNTV